MSRGLHAAVRRDSALGGAKDIELERVRDRGGGRAEFAGRAQRRSATRGSGRGVHEALRSRGIRRITDSLRWEAATVVPSRKKQGEGRG